MLIKTATVTDASSLFNCYKAEREILQDESLGIWGKARMMTTLQQAAAHTEQPKPWISGMDILRGAVGAGVGLGAGTVLAKFLGVSDATRQTLQAAGAGLGTLFNTGLMKNAMDLRSSVEQDLNNAVRMGFVRGLHEGGYFDVPRDALAKVAGFNTVLPMTPDLIAGPAKAGMGIARAGGETTGAIAGGILGDDDADLSATRADLEARALERQADVLQSQRATRLVSALLRRRTKAPLAGRVA